MLLRSSDPNSGAWHETSNYSFIVPKRFLPKRWKAGDTITWLRAKAGTPDAIVEFIDGDR